MKKKILIIALGLILAASLIILAAGRKNVKTTPVPVTALPAARSLETQAQEEEAEQTAPVPGEPLLN